MRISTHLNGKCVELLSHFEEKWERFIEHRNPILWNVVLILRSLDLKIFSSERWWVKEDAEKWMVDNSCQFTGNSVFSLTSTWLTKCLIIIMTLFVLFFSRRRFSPMFPFCCSALKSISGAKNWRNKTKTKRTASMYPHFKDNRCILLFDHFKVMKYLLCIFLEIIARHSSLSSFRCAYASACVFFFFFFLTFMRSCTLLSQINNNVHPIKQKMLYLATNSHLFTAWSLQHRSNFIILFLVFAMCAIPDFSLLYNPLIYPNSLFWPPTFFLPYQNAAAAAAVAGLTTSASPESPNLSNHRYTLTPEKDETVGKFEFVVFFL